MNSKNKKWKNLAIIAGIVLVIVAIALGIKNYLASRSVQLTMDDVKSFVATISTHLIVLGVGIVLAIIVYIIAAKMKKDMRFMVRGQSIIAIVILFTVVVNMICFGPQYNLVNNALGDKHYITEETTEKSKELGEKIVEEGIVLLENKENALPLKEQKLNVFGWGSTNPIYGGGGSGAIGAGDCVSLLDGLENAGFELNKDISDFYTKYRDTRPTMGIFGADWTVPEPTIEEYKESGVFESAKEFSDTAVIVLARNGGEGFDLPTNLTDEDTFVDGDMLGASGLRNSSNKDDLDESKSYLEPTNREQAMIDEVTAEFENVILVVNANNPMELGWVNDYDSIKGVVYCSGTGQTGFNALGKVLNGEVNPSGRLVDTFVYDLHSIPAINNIGHFQYENADDVVNGGEEGDLYATFVNYVEGIYVGYKYYETAHAEGTIDYDNVVQYPFGYGKSYSTFEQKITDISDDGKEITLTAEVTNTGDVAGKDVVEVYYTPPYTNGGIEKAEVNLVEYEKTDVINPGETQSVSISFDKEDMASYDYLNNGCYVLEDGEYNISIRSDSHTVLDSKTVSVEKDIIFDEEHDGARSSEQEVAKNQFDFAAGDVTYLSRADHFANYEEATKAPENFNMSEEQKEAFECVANFDVSQYEEGSVEMPVTGKDSGLSIRDMIDVEYDDPKWETLVDQMTIEEMNTLIALGGYSVAPVESIGLPGLIECDGPAAIKNNYNGVTGISFPCATMIASTWNKELAQQRGELMGLQCKEMRVVGWYGPAMNTHRTPFAGRNFEYYSEDGVLAGITASHEVAGARKYGVQTYMKHFALNDQEMNRLNRLCTWSNEQAIREIYLKPFEMAVKEGGSTSTMTAFNYIGTKWAGACTELLQNVLRDEWGFKGVTVTDMFLPAGGYMDADRAVLCGGDKMLSPQGAKEAHVDGIDSPTLVNAMKEASHNYLYSIVNSNAMDEGNFEMARWEKTFIGVDVAIGIFLLLIEVYIVRKFLKLKKEDTAEEV